jgi:uncharacterized membrane protein YfcA
MKEHLINQKKENKLLAYIHKIILGALILIILYNLALKYRKGNYNFFSLEEINIFMNLAYNLLCTINEINQRDIKKLYQRYFHLCFSISTSVPFLFFTNLLLNSNNNLPLDTSITNILLLTTPFILNILETIIIKRFKPLYLHLLLLLTGIITYYFIIYFFGKMGMNIGDFASERLSEIKFIIQLCIFTIIGAFGGWWLYKFLTKSKFKKIDLNSSASSELSEE